MIQANCCASPWKSVQNDLERRAETSTTALRFNLAMVEIDETFGNRKSGTKSAKLAGYRGISLFKWLKQRSQALRLNSNPCVGNFKMETSSFVVKRLDRDLSALCSEFNCVVDQVPEHLLKPDTISQDVIVCCLELVGDVYLLCC